MLEGSETQPKRRRGVSHSGSVARKRVVKKPKYQLYGPTILWDEQQDGLPLEQGLDGVPSTDYLDEMATLCLAGDSIEVLEDDFRREMRIDVLKRAIGHFDPLSNSPKQAAAFRALNDQLAEEMYLYLQELTAAGRERKWPIFIKMFGFHGYQAERLVETGQGIVEERYETVDTHVIN